MSQSRCMWDICVLQSSAESIKRTARYIGHKVVDDVHLGDGGLQIGLIITELKHRKPELVYFDIPMKGNTQQSRHLP